MPLVAGSCTIASMGLRSNFGERRACRQSGDGHRPIGKRHGWKSRRWLEQRAALAGSGGFVRLDGGGRSRAFAVILGTGRDGDAVPAVDLYRRKDKPGNLRIAEMRL